MLKQQAIELLGKGRVGVAAEALDISYQAVSKWPEVLPVRIADRVLGCCIRKGIEVPQALVRQIGPAQARETEHA